MNALYALLGSMVGVALFCAGLWIGWRARDAVKVSQGEAPAPVVVTAPVTSTAHESYVEPWDTDVPDNDA